MSSIFFIQRRNFYNNIPEHIMDPQIQQNTRTALLDELNFRRALQPRDHGAIKAILTVRRLAQELENDGKRPFFTIFDDWFCLFFWFRNIVMASKIYSTFALASLQWQNPNLNQNETYCWLLKDCKWSFPDYIVVLIRCVLNVYWRIPTLKDLDLPCLSSENHLTAGYIHPVIRHLFAHNPSHFAQR